MPKSPEVLDGYREPASERNARAAEQAAKRGSGLAPIPEGKRVFQAVALRYMAQLTAPIEQRMTDGRIIKGDRAICAKFDGGLLTLDVKKDAKTIELLEQHPDYGKDFWDFAKTVADAEKRRLEEASKSLDALAATPEGRERLRAALEAAGDEDFETPGATK